MMRMLAVVILLIILLIFNIVLPKIKKEHFESNFINSVVDKIYVINMDQDTDRLKHIKYQLDKFNLKFQRVPGVNGKKEFPKYKNKTPLRPGVLGCLLSHTNVIKDAIQNNYENILVLEDDAILHQNFLQEFETKYKFIKNKEKDIEMIYLGCSQKHNWKDLDLQEHYYTTKKNDGTFAMLINKKIFSRILQLYEKMNLPSDRVFFNHIQPNNKCFTMHPNIITANVAEYSNTENMKLDLDGYLKSNKINKNKFIFN